MSNQEDKVNLFFPPWKLMGTFLLVTMMLILGTASVGSIVFHFYLQLSPEWIMGILFSITIIFCIVNFRVTRGSFLCAKILKYYSLFLACICIPSVLIIDYYIFSFITIFSMLGAFYLLSSPTYLKLVQYQFDFFEDIKEARETVEKELLMLQQTENQR